MACWRDGGKGHDERSLKELRLSVVKNMSAKNNNKIKKTKTCT